jgi:hypothetical protein
LLVVVYLKECGRGEIMEVVVTKTNVCCRVDMQILEDAEDNYKVRADMGKQGWHYEYSLKRDAGDGSKL